jgi:hypothetical protein
VGSYSPISRFPPNFHSLSSESIVQETIGPAVGNPNPNERSSLSQSAVDSPTKIIAKVQESRVEGREKMMVPTLRTTRAYHSLILHTAKKL